MNNKQLALVTYGQARALKALGFDWKTSCYYLFDHDDDGTDKYDFIDFIDIKSAGIYGFDLFETNHNAKDGHFSAPTVSLALQWMRDVKGITNTVSFIRDIGGNKYLGWYNKYNDPDFVYTTKSDITYEAAESTLLDEIIKHLK